MSARRYAMLLAALLLLLPPGTAAAQDQVRIDVNGSPRLTALACPGMAKHKKQPFRQRRPRLLTYGVA